MRDACAELKDVIGKHFGFLAERGYRVTREGNWGGDGCLVGLEGRLIRIKFYTARDERLNVLVGGGAAAFDEGSGMEGDGGWYYIRSIAGYLDHDLTIGEDVVSMTDAEWSAEHDNQESNLARLLERHLSGIERIFAAGFENERRRYEEYKAAVDARTRSAYKARARNS